MTDRIRVLVVDDHPVVRRGLVAILRYEPGMDVVGEAEDGEAALRLIREQRPDVVLLDLRLPLRDGVEVMRQARAEGIAVRFLVLTTFDTDEYITPALAAGAQGYLLKDATPEELTGAVRSIVRGRAAIEPGVAARLLERMAEAERGEELTPRELDVLRLLVQGASNKTIAAQLDLSENTIKSHTSRIFAKLGAQSRAEAVAIALQRGLVSSRGR
jgi:DNA-binding NarL/FixJ family response regulator